MVFFLSHIVQPKYFKKPAYTNTLQNENNFETFPTAVCLPVAINSGICHRSTKHSNTRSNERRLDSTPVFGDSSVPFYYSYSYSCARWTYLTRYVHISDGVPRRGGRPGGNFCSGCFWLAWHPVCFTGCRN